MHSKLSRAAVRGEIVTGTNGNDDFRITAPTAVDGGGGYDTIRFDFTYSPVGIRLDLGGLWAGGVATLNGYEIRGVETVGSVYDGEAVIILLSDHNDSIDFGASYPGRAVVFGMDGDDLIVGPDTSLGDAWVHHALNGGAGDDIVIGGAWGDDISGEEGNDRLDGRGGDDLLFAGPAGTSCSAATGRIFSSAGRGTTG
ncbi:MAG: serralysin [Sphingomonadales bacterium]|jgi:Ca2+-binding RTX toxin-like protein|nr:serralysin [Sphingomonadales bacterium]